MSNPSIVYIRPVPFIIKQQVYAFDVDLKDVTVLIKLVPKGFASDIDVTRVGKMEQ